MKSTRRFLSYIVVALLGSYLWITWQQTHVKQAPSDLYTVTEKASPKSSNENFVPSAFKTNTDSVQDKTKPLAIAEYKAPKVPQSAMITVKTDLLNLKIDPQGGNIVFAQLLQYPESAQDKSKPITLLDKTDNIWNVAQSGLTNVYTQQPQPITFKATKTSYVLKENESSLIVTLQGISKSGLKLTKTYQFNRDDYAIKMAYSINNMRKKVWSGNLYTQLVQKKSDAALGAMGMRTYTGASISSPSKPYEKYSYKKMQKSPIDRNNQGGWVAFQQHYFLSTWVPQNQTQENHFYTHVNNKNPNNTLYTIGFISPEMTIAPGETKTTQATLYLGPDQPRYLSHLAPGLDHAVDFGWLYWLSVLIFWVLSHVESIVGNWGWAIVITTLIIKMVLYPLSSKSFRSMARMKELQPRIKSLKERHADDKQALSKETMALYKKEKVNPMGGCLPMIIQIPVFIALYYVLLGSVELRQAPFIFWIHDLSVKDPYYVLPILMGLSMLLQQLITPSAGDPAQAKMMMILPVVMTYVFLKFPAGLVLYWFVNNCTQMIQQSDVTKKCEKSKDGGKKATT